MKSLIGNILFFAVILLIITKFFCIASDTPFPIDVVTSDSMSPMLMQGDIIMWVPTSINDVQPGDVIIYNSRISWPEKRLVAHRVIETTSRDQTIYLTTKGDANPWPDQYGPHLPEPRITKDNYVGTMLTLGAIPIKIPLLGNLGIYLLGAVDILSQAAHTKNSVTYLGVFLPLTIALILLFLSLLLIPTKVKTLADKIRLLILKERGIPLRRMAAMLLLSFFLLSTCAHIFAYDSFDASIGINESPDRNTFTFGRILPGQTSFPKPVPLINPGVMPLNGFAYADGDLTPFVNQQIFYVAPGDQSQLNITATAAMNSQPGLYQGTLKIYSSALWIFLPDSLIEFIVSIAPLQTVIILDFISALVFTTISLLLMFMIILFNIQKQSIFVRRTISPKHSSRILDSLERIHHLIYLLKNKIVNKIQWINTITFHYPKKSFVIPALTIGIICSIILNYNLILVLIVPIITSIGYYIIGYKTRQQIILITNTSAIIIFGILISKTLYQFIPYNSFTFNPLQLITQIFGLIGTYLLLIGILLIPISLCSWRIISLLQNLKEYVNPLHRLEGHCNL